MFSDTRNYCGMKVSRGVLRSHRLSGRKYLKTPSNSRFILDKLAEAHVTIAAIDWQDLHGDTKKYVLENPKQTAFYVAKGVLFVAPALLTGPALGALGFTAVGPAAGSLATSAQSAIAPVAARGIFATLQSAAMGGYGASVVGGTVQCLVGTSLIGDLMAGSWHAHESHEGEISEDVDQK
ncbi:hypothetical protein IAT40_000360 [Kwoniella sp. CBS 6097]